MSEEPGRNWGRGWSAAGWLMPPGGFVAGRPRAALLFWFFGGFWMWCSVVYRYPGYVLMQK